MIPNVLLALTLATTPGTEGEAILQRAEEAVDRGLSDANPNEAARAFADAAARYDELRRSGIDNAALCRNQGNACLLAGNLPAAILAYRRGLRLAPSDQALREGLSCAREQVVYSSPQALGRPRVDWPLWLPRPRNGAQYFTAFFLYCLGCLIAGRWWLTRGRGLLGAAAGCWLLAAILGVALVREDQEARADVDKPVAVIAADDVVLRRGNGPAYPTAYETPLHRGVESRIRFIRGDWVQIELSGGEVGWVPRRALLSDALS